MIVLPKLCSRIGSGTLRVLSTSQTPITEGTPVRAIVSGAALSGYGLRGERGRLCA